MDGVLPVLVGVLCGLVRSCAYPIGLAIAKRRRSSGIIEGLVAVVSSLLLSLVALLVARLNAPDAFLAFAIAFLIVLLLVIACSIVWFVHRPRG